MRGLPHGYHRARAGRWFAPEGHPGDDRLFAAKELPALRAGTFDLSWLLSRGYADVSALKLVGDRHELTVRQRQAVSRCACSDAARQARAAARATRAQLADLPLAIDGLNCLIILESALSHGVVLRGRDGALRDLASVHGTYRQVAETSFAIEMIGRHLHAGEHAPSTVLWYLDRPVANSGRLRALLLETAERRGWPWSCELVNNPDAVLVHHAGVVATSSAVVWTGVSVIMLLAGIGAMVWFLAGRKKEEQHDVPATDPLIGMVLTPSQKATVKYFLVVTLLFLLQILMGVLTAHYGVEGGGFFGFPLAEYLPYAVTRTWHTQLGIFWIATAWLASGLFIGPIICGYEPKRQKLGVDVLFGALLIVVLGSMAGQWLSVAHKLTGAASFYFGHQGYEYVDLGRVWQAALFVGLLLWLFLVARTAIPALRRNDNRKSLLVLYLITTAGIALFYSPGLFWGMRSHLSVVEYWRWWVVHLWVEGFFEVFATVVIAFLFARLGVIRAESAAQASLLSGAVYMSGGIIGTLHHLYFAGTPTVALAFGSVFSALEIVPLTMVGFEAWENIHHTRVRPWLRQYKWVVYFFVAVAFWNLVGAGIFGFMINPPIALYYMQGLNTTAVHAHGALYGVYGTLGLALTLFCLRAMKPEMVWKERLIKFAFWAINIGMLMEILLSLLPIGLLQTYQSVSAGYWSARSPEFMQTDLMQFLRWVRIVGDMVFAIGAVAFVYFAIDLIFRRPKAQRKAVVTAMPETA